MDATAVAQAAAHAAAAKAAAAKRAAELSAARAAAARAAAVKAAAARALYAKTCGLAVPLLKEMTADELYDAFPADTVLTDVWLEYSRAYAFVDAKPGPKDQLEMASRDTAPGRTGYVTGSIWDRGLRLELQGVRNNTGLRGEMRVTRHGRTFTCVPATRAAQRFDLLTWSEPTGD